LTEVDGDLAVGAVVVRHDVEAAITVDVGKIARLNALNRN
jgi:hypothetical protein